MEIIYSIIFIILFVGAIFISRNENEIKDIKHKITKYFIKRNELEGFFDIQWDSSQDFVKMSLDKFSNLKYKKEDIHSKKLKSLWYTSNNFFNVELKSIAHWEFKFIDNRFYSVSVFIQYDKDGIEKDPELVLSKYSEIKEVIRNKYGRPDRFEKSKFLKEYLWTFNSNGEVSDYITCIYQSRLYEGYALININYTNNKLNWKALKTKGD